MGENMNENTTTSLREQSPIDAAHKSLLFSSDAIALLGLAMAIGLEVWVPWPMPEWFPSPVFWLAGGVLSAVGLLCVLSAKAELRRYAQPSAPCKPTTQLVTTGIYSRSRNPTYLGLILIVAGIGFSGLLPWLLVFIPAVFWLIQSALIKPEEAYLDSAFGDAYAIYAAATPRWIWLWPSAVFQKFL